MAGPVQNDNTNDLNTFRPGLSVLVIDDLEPLVNLLAEGLSQAGHTVLTALSGQEGLAVFDRHRVDVVICDLGMPGMNGWAVSRALTEICRVKSMRKPPVIILTGWSEQADQEKCSALGVDRIIKKPVTIACLLEEIAKLASEKNVH